MRTEMRKGEEGNEKKEMERRKKRKGGLFVEWLVLYKKDANKIKEKRRKGNVFFHLDPELTFFFVFWSFRVLAFSPCRAVSSHRMIGWLTVHSFKRQVSNKSIRRRIKRRC